MSTTNKSIIFLALAFAISWAIVIGGWALNLHTDTGMAQLILGASMFGPSIAALICMFAFEKGRRAESVGLRFKPNWWWLAAYLAPIAIAAASVALSIAFGGSTYVDIATGTIAMVEQVAPAQAEQTRAMESILAPIVLAQALVFGGLINAVILTFSEELGWRGYLHGLWRGAGFWRASLSTGVIWGLWHAPAILLYGLNYPENRPLGVALFVAYCALLAPILTFLRDRGASVWAAGIFHGVFNAVAGLTFLTLSNPAFPWNGIVGIGGFIALALGVAVVALLQGRKAEAATATATT